MSFAVLCPVQKAEIPHPYCHRELPVFHSNRILRPRKFLFQAMDNDAYHLGISFQSTHPCGGRRLNAYTVPFLLLFQSTHPMRGTTSDCRINRNCRPISIHAPHAGCDSKTRQNHHVPLHKTYIVYQIFISLALYLLMFFKQKIKIAQNSGAKSCVLL